MKRRPGGRPARSCCVRKSGRQTTVTSTGGTHRDEGDGVARRKRVQRQRRHAPRDEPHRDGRRDVLGQRRVQAPEARESRQHAPHRRVVPEPALRPVCGGHRQVQRVQLRAVREELADRGEQVVIVHAVAEKREGEVAEEGQAVRVFPELRRRVTLEHALQAKRLQLDAVRQDLGDAERVRMEGA